MKTYLHSPIPQSSCPAGIFELRNEISEVLAKNLPPEILAEKLFRLLSKIIPAKYLFIVNPNSNLKRTPTFVFPPVQPGNKRCLIRESTEEQRKAILKSTDLISVRVAASTDYSATQKLAKRHFPGCAFSSICLRSNIGGKYIPTLALLNDKLTFTDAHVAYLFIFSDLFINYWTQASMKFVSCNQQDPGPYLSLDNLPGMEKALQLVYKVTRQECPVLILGETGTGKEIVANAIYNGSSRHGAPYIKINCGSIPESLMESELFGHEKGAFTHAVQAMKGRFERADRGVLLLDEIGELPLASQTRLLRVLQENVIERVGGEKEIHLDVRIIAATHKNLLQLTKAGLFRQDLYYRLNIFPIHILPLRERPEDIPVLLEYFIYKACVKYGYIEIPRLSPSELQELCVYPWPGNIRELQNAVERSIILWDGHQKKFKLEYDIEESPAPQKLSENYQSIANGCDNEHLKLDMVCAVHIRKILKLCNGKISGKNGAAELLGIKPTTLRYKMQKLGISQKM